MALQEEINSLDWQNFQIISSLPYYLIQKDINCFDGKNHQLNCQVYQVDGEIQHWSKKLENIIQKAFPSKTFFSQKTIAKED